MTRPVTPNPGIHQDTRRTLVPPALITPQQIETWAAELALAVTRYLVKTILNALEAELPPAVTGVIKDAQAGLADVENAVGTALTQIPGGNIIGALNAGVSIAISQVTALEGYIANLSAAGLYDASQGFNNLSSSLLKYLTPTGGNIGQFDASGLFGNLNTALSLQGKALSALFNSSGAFIGAIDATATGSLNTALTYGGHALSTVLGGIETATGDFVGTVTGTVDAAATIAGQTASTVQANAQGALDAIVQAAENDAGLVNQTVAAAKAQLVSFFGGLNAAFTSGTTPASPPAASVADVSAAAAALQQRLVAIGNGGEESVDIEFSAYSNGSISSVTWPSKWTTTPTASVTSGILNYSSTNVSMLIYSPASCLTDYHQVSATFTSISSGAPCLAGRLNGSASSGAVVYYTPGTGWTLWDLSGTNAVGGNDAVFGDTFTAGAEYTLVCGDVGSSSPTRYSVLKNGVALTVTSSLSFPSQVGQTYINDGGAIPYGGSYRTCGFGDMSGSASFSMSSFKFQDNTQSEPSVLVTASESTTSTTYTDLATTSDEVAVNIGVSGKAQVFLSALVGSNVVGALSYVGFAMSGANTSSASDDLSFSIPANASNKTQLGSPFLLTGLTPGLTLFKMKYKAASGSTANFANRRIGVVAL